MPLALPEKHGAAVGIVVAAVGTVVAVVDSHTGSGPGKGLSNLVE
jgi:hypothetical protein